MSHPPPPPLLPPFKKSRCAEIIKIKIKLKKEWLKINATKVSATGAQYCCQGEPVCFIVVILTNKSRHIQDGHPPQVLRETSLLKTTYLNPGPHHLHQRQENVGSPALTYNELQWGGDSFKGMRKLRAPESDTNTFCSWMITMPVFLFTFESKYTRQTVNI